MIRLLLVFVCACLISIGIDAQSDTLLFEDFQDELNLAMELDPDIIDQWHNLDLDQIAPNSGTDGAWYWSEDFGNAYLDTIVGDTNLVYASMSWLSGLDPNNRNWLITPAIPIVDDQATLHFKSAPYQLPRYMDRVSIYVSTEESFPAGWSPSLPDQPGDYDVIFRTAEMTKYNGDGQNTDIANFDFSEGYFHADMMTDSLYFEVGDSTLNYGLLEPHSISLSDYANKQIFIAFVHDSSDDNLMSVDDILVMGTEGTLAVKDDLASEIRFITYPNPVDNYMNVLFRLEDASNGQIQIHDMQGKLAWASTYGQFYVGENSKKIDLRSLSSGSYTLLLRMEGQILSKTFIKR